MSKTTTPMTTSEHRPDVSEIYLACRNGDVEFVKNYLTKLSGIKWDANHFEMSVKSTPLHAASFYGHKEIVQLLLEHGCDRSLVNGYGLTAYEEAANDEIRHLFKRPTDDSRTNRFRDESTHDWFDFIKRPTKLVENVATPTAETQPKTKKIPAVHGYQTEAEKQLEVGYATTSIAMCQSKLGRFIADTFQSGAPMTSKSIVNRLQDVIDKEITNNKDPQSQKANELLEKYINDSDDESIKHLIRLYTLETKFYHALKQNPMPLALPLYIVSHTLSDRYFQGQSYRGTQMDDDEIANYQWAVNNHGSLLQTRHFSSTSLVRSVAETFAAGINKQQHDIGQNSVLLIFNFPEKCEQAINLSRISDEEAGLSEFEDEAEVLVLPWTLFQVDSVKKDSFSSSSPSSYTICLTNVLLPHKSILASLKWIVTHPKGSIERFYEHFPEKQPETVVKQLMNNFPISDESILKKK